MEELNDKINLFKKIEKFKEENNVITLVYFAKDKEYNNAIVLEIKLYDL